MLIADTMPIDSELIRKIIHAYLLGYQNETIASFLEVDKSFVETSIIKYIPKASKIRQNTPFLPLQTLFEILDGVGTRPLVKIRTIRKAYPKSSSRKF
jgi:hypothetical protein